MKENNLKKEEISKVIFELDLLYTEEDKKLIQKLIESYFRKRNLPNSKTEFVAGGLLWVYSRINFLFQHDDDWSQKELAKKLDIKPKSISRTSSVMFDRLKINCFDERFARKEVIDKSPFNNFFVTKEGFT